ncbi:uncharacterized protein LOC144120164 [Amblyomma americanum]
MVTLGKCCKSDPMDAMFVSADIGRGINYFFNKCSHIFLKMKPYPHSSLITKFLKSTCEAIEVCEQLFHTQDFKGFMFTVNEKITNDFSSHQAIAPCLMQWLWAQWVSYVVPLDQMKLAEATWQCSVPAVSTTRVAKHMLAYGLKITG